MTVKNLPLDLFNKHKENLGLVHPVIFDNESVLFEERTSPIESAVVFLPKSKALIDMTITLVSNFVKKDGVIVLVGANDAGIGSAKKLYEANIGPVEQKIVGNHSALYVGKNQKLHPEKTVSDFLSFSPITYKTVTVEVGTLPGVFSTGTLDEGTKLLLDSIPYENVKVLDLASGSGIVGAIYKKLAPKSDITMSDANPLAIFTSEETSRKNKTDAKILKSDVFEQVKDTFDVVLVNPPFHDGIKTDYSFIEKFVTGVRNVLTQNGTAYLVANSFLPYEKILERTFSLETVANDGKYKVLKITQLP